MGWVWDSLHITHSGLESGSELPAHPCEVTVHPGQDQSAQKWCGGFENSSTQRAQMPIEVGAVEVGQGKDEQNFQFQNQTSGIPGLQHTVIEPLLCARPQGVVGKRPLLTQALLVVPAAPTATTHWFFAEQPSLNLIE